MDSLLTKKHESAFLKLLHGRYVDRFGHLGHKLDEYEFFTSERPAEIAIHVSDSSEWHPVVDLAKILEKKGYVRFSDNRTSFFLTELGYRVAEEKISDKALTWLNKNQGAIAAAAFIVSIASLFVD